MSGHERSFLFKGVLKRGTAVEKENPKYLFKGRPVVETCITQSSRISKFPENVGKAKNINNADFQELSKRKEGKSDLLLIPDAFTIGQITCVSQTNLR